MNQIQKLIWDKGNGGNEGRRSTISETYLCDLYFHIRKPIYQDDQAQEQRW